MSTRTLALNRLMPNHWAQSHMFQRGPAINVNTDTSTSSIDAKPLGTISANMFQ